MNPADMLAAQEVLMRYAAGIDDHDWDAFHACFAPDVELPGFQREVIRGPDAWVAFVRKVLAPFEATQHMLGPPLVELSGDTAELRTDLQAQHFHREPKGRIWTVWGVYHSGLARRDGAWKIVRHTLDVRSARTTEPAEPAGS